MAHHKQYKGGLNSLPVLQAYTMTLQCVYSPKSDENGCFHHFSRYFTLKHLHGGYICSGNCGESSIWLTRSNIKVV